MFKWINIGLYKGIIKALKAGNENNNILEISNKNKLKRDIGCDEKCVKDGRKKGNQWTKF